MQQRGSLSTTILYSSTSVYREWLWTREFWLVGPFFSNQYARDITIASQNVSQVKAKVRVDRFFNFRQKFEFSRPRRHYVVRVSMWLCLFWLSVFVASKLSAIAGDRVPNSKNLMRFMTNSMNFWNFNWPLPSRFSSFGGKLVKKRSLFSGDICADALKINSIVNNWIVRWQLAFLKKILPLIIPSCSSFIVRFGSFMAASPTFSKLYVWNMAHYTSFSVNYTYRCECCHQF